MSNFVFVLDANKKPLSPCHPAVAKNLLYKGKAAVYRMFPFTVILHRVVEEPNAVPVEMKVDPGSKVTGMALVQGEKVIYGMELTHRGLAIKESMVSRSSVRGNRRARNTRYREPRFDNRKRPEGWIAPSLMHRVLTLQTWFKRLSAFAPITSVAMELVRFDMQKMRDPEISGVEYQQGTLFGYEVRHYLLAKWGHKCAYCGKTDCKLEIEHIVPRSKGGVDAVTNLTVACEPCNRRKGNKDVGVFLKDDPERLKIILAGTKATLKDAAAVNTTRNRLRQMFEETGLPVSVGSGGQTSWNRTRFGLKKSHWIDAACVGEVQALQVCVNQPLLVECTGHGSRQMCRPDTHGFPKGHRTRNNIHFGFTTGDIVKAVVAKGKKIGTYVGRVACRKTGSFNISAVNSLVQGICHQYCRTLHRKDGYGYKIEGQEMSCKAVC